MQKSNNTFSATISNMKSKVFSLFGKKNKEGDGISTKTGGGAKAFLSKLSGAFLLPISVIAIAGLFLGVGATIAGIDAKNEALSTFGNFIKNLGDPVFAALPLLFAAAVAISFTEEAGIAVFATIIGYMTFNALQSVFITPVQGGYEILFGGGGRDPKALDSLVSNTLGVRSLSTSVFGGIIVGFVVQWTYLKFHTIQLPQVISFFGGKRFVALATIIFMIPLAFAFLLLWPYIGWVFNWFGANSGKIGRIDGANVGFDSLIFGYIERILVPFGLHHVFYSPLWYTSAGADVPGTLRAWDQTYSITANSQISMAAIVEALKGSIASDGSIANYGNVYGDSLTTVALIGVTGNTVTFVKDSAPSIEKTLPLFEFMDKELGQNLGRFLQGKFSFMQWGLPAAGAAMYFAAPKENRKAALGIIFPASLTCFVTGVTEPIEFTFLFLAPLLFFGFHAVMCAISFMLMSVVGAHVGMTFSGGFLDLMIYGAVPVLKGTNFWWSFVFGAAYAPIYFFVFYFWIKKANLATPGRGGNTKLFTKKDYLAQKEAKNSVPGSVELDSQALKIIEGYGGVENITKTANCASRLRFDVKDASLIDEDILKSAGVFGVRKTSDTHVQSIVGTTAEQLRVKIEFAINELRKQALASQSAESLEEAIQQTDN